MNLKCRMCSIQIDTEVLVLLPMGSYGYQFILMDNAVSCLGFKVFTEKMRYMGLKVYTGRN